MSSMSMDTTADWGPLARPIHHDIPDGSRPWRDNAFLCFWDPARELSGVMHVSTSPNAEGRRARVSVKLGTTSVEVIEPLDPGTWNSASISFDPNAGFTIDSPQVSGEVRTTPLYALANFAGDASPVVFGLDRENPLSHFQRGAAVTGHLVVDGQEVEVNGHAFRDRTWGFRDESSSLDEYYGWMWVFDGFAVAAFRLLGQDGSDSTLGYVLTDDGTTDVIAASITRDASGLFAATEMELADGRRIGVRNMGRHSSFWCPMGWERSGPVLSAYDEFCALRTDDGTKGFGMIEQGITRRLV
jgi:hypothetical protein